MSEEKIEKTSAISNNTTDKVNKVVSANKDYFEALMNQKAEPHPTNNPNQAVAIEEVKKPSLMDEVKNSNGKSQYSSTSSSDKLITQSDQAIDKIDSVKETLAASPDAQIKSSYHNLLKNKLSHIDDNLQITLSKAGVEYTSEVKVESQGLMNPIEKYMGYLTHSQDQLKHLSEYVQAMHDNRQELSPANMLSIQIKVGYIQQELEFFTSLLNKALESTKTLMNVQV
jgi:hypothetical protein